MQLNSAPLITYYSVGSSVNIDSTLAPTRVELSQATVDNWVAKTSNLLAEEFGYGPELVGEASAAVDLPLHWLHSVWLTSLWNVGAYVTTRRAQAGVLVNETAGVDTALAKASRNQAVVGVTLGAGLDPLGTTSEADTRTMSPAAVEYSHVVRMFADSFESGYSPQPGVLALETASARYTFGDLEDFAQQILASHNVGPGGRVLLTNLPTSLSSDAEAEAAVALGGLIRRTAQGSPPASLVLCNGLTPEQVELVLAQERATVI